MFFYIAGFERPSQRQFLSFHVAGYSGVEMIRACNSIDGFREDLRNNERAIQSRFDLVGTCTQKEALHRRRAGTVFLLHGL